MTTLSLLQYLLGAGAGVLVGLSLGMVGGGGSILAVPLLAYLVGVVFFVLDSRLRFGHFVWHLFVLGGSLCHFFTLLLYVA